LDGEFVEPDKRDSPTNQMETALQTPEEPSRGVSGKITNQKSK
jgi:hypothetical protein